MVVGFVAFILFTVNATNYFIKINLSVAGYRSDISFYDLCSSYPIIQLPSKLLNRIGPRAYFTAFDNRISLFFLGFLMF